MRVSFAVPVLILLLLPVLASAALPDDVVVQVDSDKEAREVGLLNFYGCAGGGPDQYKHQLGSWAVILDPGPGVSTNDVLADVARQTGLKIKQTTTLHTTFGQAGKETTWRYLHRVRVVEGYVISGLLKQNGVTIGAMPVGAFGKFKVEIPVEDSAGKEEKDCPAPMPVCGNGVAEAGEQCGEPGLPQCQLGQTCVKCHCLPRPKRGPPLPLPIKPKRVYTPGPQGCDATKGQYLSYNACAAACQPPNVCQGGSLDPSGCWLCKPATQTREPKLAYAGRELATELTQRAIASAPRDVLDALKGQKVNTQVRDPPGSSFFDVLVAFSPSGEASVREGSAPDAAYRVQVNRRALENIAYSHAPGDAFAQSVKSGDLAFDSTDPQVRVKLALLKSLLPDASPERAPGEDIDLEDYVARVEATVKGLPYYQDPVNGELVVLNRYGRPLGYSSPRVQRFSAYRPEQVSRSGGCFSVPTGTPAFGLGLGARLQQKAPAGASARDYVRNTVRDAVRSGGQLRAYNTQVGVPSGPRASLSPISLTRASTTALRPPRGNFNVLPRTTFRVVRSR